MADESRIRPFSTGSEFADWTASNCDQCVAIADCPLQQALDIAYLTDGKMTAHAVALIGCDGVYPKPCTLRHHTTDDSLSGDEVLAKIDAALNGDDRTAVPTGGNE